MFYKVLFWGRVSTGGGEGVVVFVMVFQSVFPCALVLKIGNGWVVSLGRLSSLFSGSTIVLKGVL